MDWLILMDGERKASAIIMKSHNFILVWPP
uniref:Uncharacterized protein n=1 Tax=Rhizophora mucronata TaxID=61149 RepID=A0A2P2QFD8_RHIMU